MGRRLIADGRKPLSDIHAGSPNVVLWTAAADSMPASPVFSLALDHLLVWSIVQAAVPRIGYHSR